MSEELRARIGEAKRLVVKVGSSSLTTPDGFVDHERINQLVRVLSLRHAAGSDIVLVSSGAIASGLKPLRMTRRPHDLATQQAAASVGQGLLLARYTHGFYERGIPVGQVLLTADDVVRQSHYRNARQTLTRLLELKVLPVVNENDTVATDEIRFGDNDRLAAIVSHLVSADALVILSDVDALYDGDPRLPGSSVVSDVMSAADLESISVGGRGSGVGSGGMVTKVEAARLATDAGIPVVLTSAANAAAAISGEPVGTLFHPTGRRSSSLRLWLAHASDARGRVHVDAGAAQALRAGGASLLAVGITKVEGEFEPGDPIDVVDQNQRVLARGLVAYDAAEVEQIRGRSTRELGADHQRPIIHRDDLAMV